MSVKIETNLVSVITAIQEKKRNPLSSHRIWLVIGGGAMAGAHGGGGAMALVDAGCGFVFDGVIGVSTGAATLGYFLSVRKEDGADHNYHQASVYSIEARSRQYFRPGFRLYLPWMMQVLRGLTGKPIVWEKVVSHPARYVIVVTDWETGHAHYVEPQNREEMFTAIEGACAIPLMANPVMLRNRLATDSSASDALPIDWLMRLPEHERPTHILVIANTSQIPPSQRAQKIERMLIESVLRHRAPAHIRQGFANRNGRFYEIAEHSQKRTDVVVGIDWLPWEFKSLDRNSKRIQQLTKAGYDRFIDLMNRPREH